MAPTKRISIVTLTSEHYAVLRVVPIMSGVATHKAFRVSFPVPADLDDFRYVPGISQGLLEGMRSQSRKKMGKNFAHRSACQGYADSVPVSANSDEFHRQKVGDIMT